MKQITLLFFLFGLCAIHVFSQSKDIQATDSNLYLKALSACYSEQAKTAKNIHPENKTDFYSGVVEQNNSLIENFPTRFGEFKIEYLNRKSIAERYKKTKQRFGVRVAHPMQNIGDILQIRFADFIVSYRKRVYEYGLEGGCIVDFKFDCPLQQFTIAKVDLWGV
jgi:hypothetical protein